MQFSLVQVSGAVFAVATASAAASWYLRGEQIDVLKERIHAYETVEGLNLKDLASSAEAAAKALSVQLVRSNEVEDLRRKNSELEVSLSASRDQTAALNKDLQEKSAAIQALDTQLKSLFSDYQQFTLGKGQVRKLFQAKYALAVTNVYGGSVNVILNNKNNSMDIGQYIELSNNGHQCKMILEGVSNYNTASFSVLCDKT